MAAFTGELFYRDFVFGQPSRFADWGFLAAGLLAERAGFRGSTPLPGSDGGVEHRMDDPYESSIQMGGVCVRRMSIYRWVRRTFTPCFGPPTSSPVTFPSPKVE